MGKTLDYSKSLHQSKENFNQVHRSELVRSLFSKQSQTYIIKAHNTTELYASKWESLNCKEIQPVHSEGDQP